MPTETPTEAPRPVLVGRKTSGKKRRTTPNLPPQAAEVKPESPPPVVDVAPPPPAEVIDGKPDHSLVPSPRKKLLPIQEALAYWNSVPQKERDEWFIGYLYRDLPYCDPSQPLSVEELRQIERQKKKKPEKNCAKLVDPQRMRPDLAPADDVASWLQQIRECFGAGDYHLRLNDQHPSIKTTVVEFEFTAGRDWDSYPPAVDLAEVVLSDPRNDSYIRWAHLKGIQFPGEAGAPVTPFDEDEDEMANVSAVIESNKHLTDRVIEMSQQAQKPAPVPVAPPAPPDRSNEILADAALKGQQILLDSVRAQGKAQDPMEFHKAVTEAAKAMVPPPAPSSDNGGMLVMMQTMMSQQATQFQALMAQQATGNAAIVAQLEKRLESSERRAEAAEQRAQAALQAKPTAGTDNGITNALALIDGLAKLKDKTTSILGTEAADADLPVWARVGMKVAENLPDMLHNAAVMWTGKGTPVPPLSPEVIEAENQPPAVEAAQQQPQQQEEEVFGKSRIAQELAAPLMDAINKGHHGFEFAAGMILQPKIMGFPGRVVYEMAIEEGQDGLLQILQSHPPLWQQLMVIPKRLQSFITEFLDRDMAYQVAKGAQQQAQQPPPSPGPAQETAPAEVLPPQQPANGRVVMGADGKPIQTVGKKGPVVNGPAQTPLSAS